MNGTHLATIMSDSSRFCSSDTAGTCCSFSFSLKELLLFNEAPLQPGMYMLYVLYVCKFVEMSELEENNVSSGVGEHFELI